MCQSAFLVCIMNDGDFYFSQTSIKLMSSIYRSQINRLLPLFLISMRVLENLPKNLKDLNLMLANILVIQSLSRFLVFR